jgi:tetraacyldisaccharide 4'-kinase
MLSLDLGEVNHQTPWISCLGPLRSVSNTCVTGYTLDSVLEQKYLNLISGETRGPLAAAARGVLRLAEIPYSLAMLQRNRRYDRRPPDHDDPPTISVGNITAGGTGKTPVVQWLADQLQSAGHYPAILTRGYIKSGSTLSDEATMLHNLLPYIPVIAHPDRMEGASIAMIEQPETTCFVLDDGFQHRRFPRSFDLVLINATEPFGFGHVHPRGLLREPLCGLKRASAILITHASEVPPEALLQTQDTIRQHTSAPIFHADHVNTCIVSADNRTTRELSDLATIPFMLFTGIGQPQPLCASLKRFASAYKTEYLFDDHHHYTPADISTLEVLRQLSRAQIFLTTEKDWTKLKPIWPADNPYLYRLQLSIRFWENEQDPFLHLISKAILPNEKGT